MQTIALLQAKGGLGDEAAAAVARSFLLELLHRCGSIHATGVLTRRVLLYAPKESEADFKALLAAEGLDATWELHPQIGGLGVDLTAKLSAALDWSSATSMAGTVFIGMDTPDVPDAALVTALDTAARGAAYIRCATDGGYVAIGQCNTSATRHCRQTV